MDVARSVGLVTGANRDRPRVTATESTGPWDGAAGRHRRHHLAATDGANAYARLTDGPAVAAGATGECGWIAGLDTNLVGPPATIRDRLVEYERSGVTTLRVGVTGTFDDKITDLETLVALAAEAGGERDPQHDTTAAGATS